jgi:hypothetical protein
MPDFTTGNAELDKMLDWVAPPPPPAPPVQGRDTHVIRFLLREQTPGVTSPAQYRGLMVWRPRNTLSGPVAQLPGLTATGTIANKDVAQVEPAWVRVEVFFRPHPQAPADVFATLRFMRNDSVGLPSTTVRNPEVNVSLTPNFVEFILESSPERWVLDTLRRTTLLFGPSPP